MPELTPIPSAQRPADPGYQPLSGYAVAAALVAGAFGLIALYLLVQALFFGRAALIEALLVLPVVGIILAAIARSHIRNAEGTRTGLKLATAAWWVCVLGGVAYLAYMQANAFALKRESGRSADRFFDKLKNGRVHHAFEDLIPPEERGRESPENPEAFETAYATAYAPFKAHDLVRLMMRNGSAVEVERVGSKDFGQEENGFRATHLYRLTCPEGVFDVQVRLMATESKKSRQPVWYIPSVPAPNISIRPDVVSEYGRLVRELEQEADDFSKTWMAHLVTGRITWAHVMTLPRTDGRLDDSKLKWWLAMGGGPAASFPLRRELLPPDRAGSRPAEPPGSLSAQARLGFDDLAAAGFFRTDAAGTALSPERLIRLREFWAPPRLVPAGAMRQTQSQSPAEVPEMTIAADGVTYVVPAELMMEATPQYIRCRLAVVCTAPDVLSAVAAARAKGPTADDPAVSLRSLPSRDWRIAWVQTNAEPVNIMPMGPGAPPGGPRR